jgi:energy-coupling factor transport system ATP-binding protein
VSGHDRRLDHSAPAASAGATADSGSSGSAGAGNGSTWSGSAQAGRSAAPSSADPAAPSGAPSAAPSIELEGVSFSYPDGTPALENIELRIDPGELVAIVGQNGSGKSTLARHLNGLLRPTAGRILLGGRDVRGLHVARLAERVGLAFQNPDRQLFAGRVSAEVAFGPRNLGLRGAELDERVRAALDAVGLSAEAASNPYDLGYSRRKLLSLASVLAMRTPILVLDEPTTGQDARGAARVRAVVAVAAGEGRTVIAISHDMRFVAECFRRVVVMRAGRVVLDGTPDVVFGEATWPELRAAYLEPPFAALAGARLGLGATPSAASFVAALGQRARNA